MLMLYSDAAYRIVVYYGANRALMHQDQVPSPYITTAKHPGGISLAHFPN